MTTTYKLSINVQEDYQIIISEDLEEHLGAHAISLTKVENQNPAESLWKVEAYFLHAPSANDVKQILQNHLGPSTQNTEIQIEQLPDEDWVAKVQSNLTPVPAGRFIIHGSHDRALFRGHPYAIEIDAGQAFGTAHHGTTKGCLLAIEKELKKQNFKNILDLGTGSGILAIAAAKMAPTAKVLASDIDRISVEVASDNFKINNTKHLITGLHAPGLTHRALQNKSPYDLLIANILAKPLKGLAKDISKAVTKNGTIILSGLMTHQTKQLVATYRQYGFVLQNKIPLEGWMTLTLRKNKKPR